MGVSTNRDAWCWNPSKRKLTENMGEMITFYNEEVIRFQRRYAENTPKEKGELVQGFLNADPKKISWTVNLKKIYHKVKITNSNLIAWQQVYIVLSQNSGFISIVVLMKGYCKCLKYFLIKR